MRRREGFTLIELLIVIVVIGILAVIAIPKIGKAREKAYFRAMISDLRTLGTQQELYFTYIYSYAPQLSDLQDFDGTQGVTVEILAASTAGWAATAAHAALDAAQQCGIYHGSVASPPSFTLTAGIVGCTGE